MIPFSSGDGCDVDPNHEREEKEDGVDDPQDNPVIGKGGLFEVLKEDIALGPGTIFKIRREPGCRIVSLQRLLKNVELRLGALEIDGRVVVHIRFRAQVAATGRGSA